MTVGFTYCLASSGYAFYQANFLEELAEPSKILYAPTNIPEDWGIELEPEDRKEKTTLFARTYFERSGSIGRYVDTTGTWQPFCPTDTDLIKRREVVDFECDIKHVIAQNRKTAWYWIVSSMIALLFGYIASNEKLRREFGFAS